MDSSIITQVPEDILFNVLSTWSELKSVNLLDTAFCNSNVRNYVLDCFRSPISSLNGVEKLNTSIIKYISVRGLKLREMNGNLTIFHEIFMLTVPLVTTKVNAISVIDQNWPRENIDLHDNVIELINACPQLTSLTLKGRSWFRCDAITQINTKVLTQLNVLIISQKLIIH